MSGGQGSGGHGARFWGFMDQGPLAAIAGTVRQYEEIGMAGVIVPQIYAPPWSALAAASALTSNLRLVSGVAHTFTRSPFETAMTALDLDRLSGGRFVLGLGTSVRSWSEQRFGVPYDHPIARFREALTLIRRLTTLGEQGEVGRHDGRFYQIDLRGTPLPRPVRAAIPIWVGALRRPAIELTGELGDGLLGHPAWSITWLEREVRHALDAGLERAGRERAAVAVIPWLRVAISDDIEQATKDAKAGLPMYAGLAQYRSYFAEHGLADEASRVQQLVASGASPQDQANAIPDEMARTFVLIGRKAEVEARLDELVKQFPDMSLTPPIGVPRERSAEYAAAIASYVRERAGRQ